jgi:uncharacterized protein (DUF433 family)
VLNLVVVRDGHRVFTEVIEAYLRRTDSAKDGYPSLIRVPAYERAKVVVDPTRAFGAPVFERGGARVEDMLGRFWAGESLEELSDVFGVPADQLEDIEPFEGLGDVAQGVAADRGARQELAEVIEAVGGAAAQRRVGAGMVERPAHERCHLVGRAAVLRPLWPQGRAGSIPAPDTAPGTG